MSIKRQEVIGVLSKLQSVLFFFIYFVIIIIETRVLTFLICITIAEPEIKRSSNGA